MAATESTAAAEQRLRGILPYIASRDLVLLRQMLPQQVRLTERVTTDPTKTFSFQSRSTQNLAHKAEAEQRLQEALQSLTERELRLLRQLVPQYQQTMVNQADSATTTNTAGRFVGPPPPPTTRCRSRSRSRETVDRSFCFRCSVECAYSGCLAPCGKPVFSVGSRTHLRHYCQDHR